MRVLMVCTGNTCRSPMAAALLEWRIAESPELRGRVLVESAGTGATPGEGAAVHARETMKRPKYGLDIESHQARPLSRELLEGADLVLGMNGGHRKTCGSVHPSHRRIFTIGEFAGTGEDVSDPFGQGLEEYEECAGQLVQLVDLVVERLIKERAAAQTPGGAG